MADQTHEEAVEARLRDFLAVELRQAELDFPLMASPRMSRHGRRSFAVALLTIVVLLVAVAIGRWAGPLPATGGHPQGVPSGGVGLGSPSVAPSANAPSPGVTCLPEQAIRASGESMTGECGTAIIAFEALAAPLGTIARVRIEAGFFDCSDLWPGAGSMPSCYLGGLGGPIVPPGSEMHGWVSFEGTDKVAAIALWRTPVGQSLSPSFGPWQGHAEAFVAPPVGWVIP